MELRWSDDKNKKLFEERGITFEEIVSSLENGGLLADVDHPKRTNQRILVVALGEYAYAVPYVQEKNDIVFLKTAYPSRLFTREFLL